ncbi:MAG: hypothetical protein KGO96_04895 [Elusimicrobia bacterium]|nr:hypothetical protein [Elusimicrobiota bacterium]MDE2425228.1 hypothetical protein [Elusimicrobiota bacterium]
MKGMIVVALLCCAGQAGAQSLDGAQAKAGALARLAQQELKPGIFARKIVCVEPRAPGLPDFLRFYTRLNAVRSLAELPADEAHALPVWDGGSAKPDESAARLPGADYLAASITRETFRYSAWTCDSTDYWFSFATASLLRHSGASQWPVKAHLVVETRGQTDWEGDLDCVAR